ncbi:AI-2E family transporter [Methylosinus sp. KRF6]|uniref:AI-2E family transporter n=1 Tax=Methylosinus sp. KRF6 TaxID=2846853 RepID=UPI001C0E4C16|nr:AI-2E family transporter [Methylosinus sp. KRF6]MBU3887883.1 AI-2E family transporter [Methylosinus sp. KRF6]
MMSFDRNESDPRTPLRSPNASLWIIGVTGLVLFYLLRWVLLPFVIAALVALVCTPLIDRCAARGRSRGVCATIIFLLVLTIVAALGFFGALPLIGAVERLATGDMQDAIAKLVEDTTGGQSHFLGQRLDANRAAESATAALRNWLEEPSRITKLSSIAIAALFGGFLTLVLLLYLLVSGPRLARGLLWLVPERERGRLEAISSALAPAVRRYFIGVFIIVVYAAVVAYVGLGLLLGLRHAVPLAVLTGVLELIPIVGPAASAITAGLIALAQAKSIGAVLAYAAYAVALRLSIDQVVGPLVLGKAAQLHPIIIILSFLIGAALFGVSGALLAIPFALAVKVTVATSRGQEAFENPRA